MACVWRKEVDAMGLVAQRRSAPLVPCGARHNLSLMGIQEKINPGNANLESPPDPKIPQNNKKRSKKNKNHEQICIPGIPFP
eukprot:6415696-Amphidinium_carterae.1